MNIDFRKVFRASVLTGMTVKNMEGHTLGKIEDVVIDVGSGRLEYAALSCGGFLGMGSKLFAIPWDAFALKYDEKSTYFVLDMNAAKLQSAPGFDRAHWPDMGDPNWAAQIDDYYSHAQANGRRAQVQPGASAMASDAQAATAEVVLQPARPAAVKESQAPERAEDEDYFVEPKERATAPSSSVHV